MALGNALATGAVVGITIKAIDEFSKTFDKASGGLGAIGKAAGIGVAGVTAFAAATVALTKEFIDLGVAGSEVNDFTNEFNRLAGSQAVETMNKMQKATLGAVSKLDLMNTANKLMISGMKAESLPALSDYATRLGEATSEFGSATDIMNTFGTALATGRTAQLAQMGVMIDAEKLVIDYADAMGYRDEKGKLMTSWVDKETRAMLVSEEAMRIVNERLTTMPVVAEDAGSKMAKLSATWEDMKNDLAASLEPAVMSLLDKFQEFLPTLEPLLKQFGEMGILLLDKLMPVIEKLAPYITKIIQDYMPKIIDLFFKIFDALIPLLDPLFEILDAVLPPLIDLIDMIITDIGTDLIKTLADLLVMLAPVLKVLIELITNVLKPIMPILNVIIQIIGVVLAAAINLILPILQFFSEAWETVGEKIEPIIDFLKGVVTEIKKVIDWFKKMPTDIGGFVSGIFGGSKQTGGLINQTGNYLLHKGETVLPSRETESSNGGVNIVITGNIYGVDATDIAEALQKKLNRMIKY